MDDRCKYCGNLLTENEMTHCQSCGDGICVTCANAFNGYSHICDHCVVRAFEHVVDERVHSRICHRQAEMFDKQRREMKLLMKNAASNLADCAGEAVSVDVAFSFLIGCVAIAVRWFHYRAGNRRELFDLCKFWFLENINHHLRLDVEYVIDALIAKYEDEFEKIWS